MTLRELSALVSLIIVVFGTIWYICLVLWGQKVKPVLATWIVLSGTMTLGFVTYLTAPKHSLISNIGNTSGVITTLSVFLAVAWKNMKGGKRVQFNRFQFWSLMISLAIAILWIAIVWGFKGTGIVPNILTQILMAVGYIVTAERLWYATKNTESLMLWWCVAISSAIALYTAILSHDGLAVLYSVRATITSGTLVWLMYRADKKSQLIIAS